MNVENPPIDVYALLVEELNGLTTSQMQDKLVRMSEFVDVVDNDTVDELYGMVRYLLEEREYKSEYLLSD